MRQYIIDAIATIMRAILQNMQRSFSERIDKYLSQKGTHFDRLLK